MQKEYIAYTSDLPINITYASVNNYPLHWHNSIEIIYVLKGKVNISIDTDSYELYENEIEIINENETHTIHSDIENKLLIFHIDPNYFEKYYSDINNIFFYTNSSDDGAQEGPEYDELRGYLSRLLCEAVQRQEDYDEEIEDILIKLLFHLVNNFHYLIQEQDSLKENSMQLERYHRISKYIFNNYNNNITLQSIAKKEFLSPHYLSHEIKNTTGYSFTDLLNLTRVEESVKLLLDSDMSISEISEEVGFSHTRYFNKNFKFFYNCTPLQFKRKNKLSSIALEKSKTMVIYPLEDSLKLLVEYLKDYERYNYENKLSTISLNMNNSLGKFNEDFREIITLGDAFDLLIEDNKDILEALQDEIHFNYGRLENFFSDDMGIFKGVDFFNWNRAKSVLEFINYIDLYPLILIDNDKFNLSDYKKVLSSFISYFTEIELIDLSKIKFQFSSKMTDKIKCQLHQYISESLSFEIIEKTYTENKSLNTLYDTVYMLPYIIHNEIFTKKDISFLKAFDVVEKETDLNNEVFIGSPGIINDMSIRKPSYYAYYLLSKLSGEIVSVGNGYIVTKNNLGFNILLYTYNSVIENLLDADSQLQKNEIITALEKEISLNITNVPNDSRMIFYEINEKVGSSYNYWLSMGSPDRLNNEEMEILSKASFPKIEFRYSKKSSVLNIISKLKGYGATLILIKPMKSKKELKPDL
jgi:AraC-like DNA-binding protein